MAEAPRSPPGQTPLKVLLIEMGVGFGGATKSASLLSRRVGNVECILLTSQKRDIIESWFDHLRVYKFRGFLNYKNRWRFGRLLDRLRVPGGLRLAGWIFTMLERVASPWYLVKILWISYRERVELIHLQNGFQPTEAFLAGRILGLPVVAHLRTFFDGSTPSTYGARLGVIGDSQSVTASVPQGILAAVPSTTIYEPVELEAFEINPSVRAQVRNALGLGAEDVAVGIFGRVIDWKGQREFVLAAFEAFEHDDRIHGFVIGDASDGDPRYLSDLQALVKASDHRDRIQFLGYISDVEPLYQAMDIIVHASTQPEPCGMVVLEGMAARRPVIASAAGGPKELISDGVDGRLVTPGDVKALAKAMLELAGNPALRTRMGKSAHETAQKRFSSEISGQELRAFYARMLEAGPESEAPP